MKILLTNTDLGFRAGSELWTLTMYNELSKEHDVDVFTCGSNNIIKASYDENKEYDLAIINHNNCLARVREFKIKRRIFTSHGIIPHLERPAGGADVYVAVSEEVQAGMKVIGFDSVIIRNPIDTELFKEEKPINKTLKNILHISNRRESQDTVIQACHGYNLEIIGGGRSVSNTHEFINNADLVITLGRGVYESLACNRNVIVFDRGNGDGLLTEMNIYDSRQNNCSGRNKGIKFDSNMLKEEFKKYDPDLKMREYILRHNNITKSAQEYLNL